MESLKLTFPSFQSGQEFITETEPKAIEAWLNQLAYVKTNHTINELTRVVKTLNRCHQSLSDREKNLYLLNQGYLTLSRHMREQHDRHKAFVDKHQYKALHNLSTEMAFGFKRLIDELSGQRLLLRRSRLANAINYAQHYLGLMLIEQYQLYSPIPVYLWRELHLLYEYAEKHKLSKKVLYKEEPLPLEPCKTIEESFIRNCLMAVINPYHIEDNQHWHLFKYLAHWSKLVEITSDLNQFREQRCFIIDLSESDKPHITTEESEYENESQIRLLKTNSLLNNIENQISDYQNRGKLPEPGFYEGIESSNALKLVTRIYDFCNKFVERDSARYPVITNVDAVWGLTHIKNIIMAEQDNNESYATEQAIKNVLNPNYSTLIRWQAVNHSEGGICLRNHLQVVDSLRIGNLVILKRYVNGKPKKDWQLAIARWLKGEHIKGATVGLEYIHGEMQFIHYLTINNLKQTVEHPVLLIKPYDASNPILITAKNLMGGHKIIKLAIDGEEKEVRISHLIETNAKISIFELKI